MNTIYGRLPGSSTAVQIDFDQAIQAVDELISPAQIESIHEFVATGFIDVQVNGFGGIDFNNPDTSHDDLLYAMRLMATCGVTRCCPTVITASEERMLAVLRNLSAAHANWVNQGLPEAPVVAGFHVEGPHLSPEEGPRGAHPATHIRPPDIEAFMRLQDAAQGHIRIVTLSPEWEGAIAYIQHIVRQGIVASIGHTKASAQQIQAAVDAGATMSTHLGNGAHALLHKTQNYIWEQLVQDKLNAGFIVDGIHLPGAFLRAALRAKGLERCFLVTDAVAPAMCPPGSYELSGNEVSLRADGSVVLRGTERLAGSALRMDHAIANVVRIAGLTLREALTLATINPARAARIAGRTRGLTPGEKADFVLFSWNPERQELHTVQTIIAGQQIPREALRTAAASL